MKLMLLPLRLSVRQMSLTSPSENVALPAPMTEMRMGVDIMTVEWW